MNLDFDFKTMIQSKTVMGGFIAILASLANLIGYSVSPGEQASLVEAIISAAGALGGMWAVIGRVVATKRISGVAEVEKPATSAATHSSGLKPLD